MLLILGLVGAALVAGAFVYLAVKLTVSVLKMFKTKKNSKVMAAAVKDLIRQAPTMKLDDLDEDDVILAEYDEDKDDLVDDIQIATDVDIRVSNILDMSGGIVVFD